MQQCHHRTAAVDHCTLVAKCRCLENAWLIQTDMGYSHISMLTTPRSMAYVVRATVHSTSDTMSDRNTDQIVSQKGCLGANLVCGSPKCEMQHNCKCTKSHVCMGWWRRLVDAVQPAANPHVENSSFVVCQLIDRTRFQRLIYGVLGYRSTRQICHGSY